jgi:hypothetical protein
MPKVAICFWGICRTTNHTIDSIKEYIYKPLDEANIEYEIFVHTFTLNTPYTNTRCEEYDLKLDNELYKLLGANNPIVEDQDIVDANLNLLEYRTHGDPWVSVGSKDFGTFNNHIRALYSLHKVTTLALESNPSKILFLRPDVKFLNPIQPTWLRNIKYKEILLADFHCYPVNDRFALAFPKAAKIFGLRFEKALEYSKTNRLHSEQFLMHCLKSENIKHKLVKFRFRRIRAPNLMGDTNVTV